VSKSPEHDLRQRAFRFTCDLFDLCEDLTRTPGISRRLGYQLFGAGSSIGANLEEAVAAYSRKDFTSKQSISLRESRESKYWLRVADAKGLGNKEKRQHLLREADEFVAMLTTSVKHLRRGLDT
jgi:four helix bundle protein